MAKQYANAPVRIVTRARDFYANALCNCGRRVNGQHSSVVNCTLPKKPSRQLKKKYDVGGKEIESSGDDLQGLMQLLSAKNGSRVKVDIDSEGNLVWRKQVAVMAETSYGGGVGRIGRIDEDKPCSFNEVDVNKLTYYSRSTISRRNVGC